MSPDATISAGASTAARSAPADARPMLLALASDGAYAMPLATTLRSMVESNTAHWPIEIHVLVEHFPQQLRQRVKSSLPAGSATIRWIDADLTRYSHLSATAGVTRPLPRITYARLLLPQVLPARAPRALYLDADILVLQDLGALWQADLKGTSVGAVLDGMDSARRGGAPAFAQVPRVRRYFNAGVLLMDLDRCRARGLAESAHRFLQAHPWSPYADQDALNVACDGDWLELDHKWNHQTIYHPVSLGHLPADRLPGIAHFVTGNKPWKASVLSPHAGYYDGFRSRTLFARTRGERLRDGAAAGWARAKTILKRLKVVRSALRQLNKSALPSIQSLDEGRP
jgi:lipopolysaccharide biosynthesis glycosyltransferase